MRNSIIQVRYEIIISHQLVIVETTNRIIYYFERRQLYNTTNMRNYRARDRAADGKSNRTELTYSKNLLKLY